jgi:hypothetical protein
MRQASGSAIPQSANQTLTTPRLGSQFESSGSSTKPADPVASQQIDSNPATSNQAGSQQVGPWQSAPPGSGPMLPDRNQQTNEVKPNSPPRSDRANFDLSATATSGQSREALSELPLTEAPKSQPTSQPVGFAPQTPATSSALHPVQASQRKIEVIGSKRFRLNYDLAGIHPDDVERVVLWATRDGGQTWSSLGEDADNLSPFPVQVDDVGTYGFRIVFHTRNGLSARTPARGDDADVWISIDTSPPVAALTSAPYGRGDQAGHLVINWQALDEQLQMRPISLAYSAQPTGPWTWIVERTENTGSYAWKIGAEIPDQVYLQMTVVDAAGNVTTNQTNEPIDLTGLVPRGRIIGVQPIK